MLALWSQQNSLGVMTVSQEFRCGHAGGADWRIAAQSCLDQVGTNAGNLGFLYVTDVLAEHLEEILNMFRSATGVESWVGAVGMGVCASGIEYLDGPAIVALTGSFDPDSFKVFSGLSSEASVKSAVLSGNGAEANFAIVHADPNTQGVDKLVRGLARRVESGFLVGGLTSSRGRNLQIADDVIEGGVSGVAFTDSVVIATRLTQGCSPIGPRHNVTESQRNVLVSLDSRPAFDVFLEDIGEKLARDLNHVGSHVFVGISVKGSDTGDYLARNLVGIDTESKLIAIGEMMKPGGQIMFLRRDGKTARDDMARMIDSIRQGLFAKPSAGVYYSCLGRGGSLFGGDSAELKMIQDAFGDIPLAGFFCNGEISHNRLYGYTGVLTLFV
jgi:small ligand-binding sensory domain FIST